MEFSEWRFKSAPGVALLSAALAWGSNTLAQDELTIGMHMIPVPSLSEWTDLAPETAVEWTGEALGLLRGAQGAQRLTSDIIRIVEYTGSGLAPDLSAGAAPRAMNVDKAVLGLEFSQPAARYDLQSGGTRRVQVVHAGKAWDETLPGVGAHYVDNAAGDRENLIWLSPHGAVLGALWAGPDASVSQENGRGVVSYQRNGRSFKLFLDEAYRPVQVEMQAGGKTYLGEYADYRDRVGYNLLCPTSLKQSIDGRQVMDLALSYCATNIYLKFLEPGVSPESLPEATVALMAEQEAALIKAQQDTLWYPWEEYGEIENQARPSAPVLRDGRVYPDMVRSNNPITSEEMRQAWQAARSQPTPRVNGKPVYTGHWRPVDLQPDGSVGRPAGFGFSREEGALRVALPARGSSVLALEMDGYLDYQGQENKPLYKPEHWYKIRDLDVRALSTDGVLLCEHPGLPRVGPPRFVAQGEDFLILILGGSTDDFRFIRINQNHLDSRIAESHPLGSSVASWDGDTLVIETKGLSDETWFAPDGYFRTLNSRVIERITRTGNTISYDVRVEDPEVLLRPWVMDTQYFQVVNDPGIDLARQPRCNDTDIQFTPGSTHL